LAHCDAVIWSVHLIIQDAVRLLKEIKDKEKEQIYEAVKKLAPFTPHIPEPLLRKRFDGVWDIAFKKQPGISS